MMLEEIRDCEMLLIFTKIVQTTTTTGPKSWFGPNYWNWDTISYCTNALPGSKDVIFPWNLQFWNPTGVANKSWTFSDNLVEISWIDFQPGCYRKTYLEGHGWRFLKKLGIVKLYRFARKSSILLLDQNLGLDQIIDIEIRCSFCTNAFPGT